MMYVTVKTKCIEVKLTGNAEAFSRDLALLKSIPEEDRYFDTQRLVWVIHNPEKYTHIKPIYYALKDRAAQMELF